MVFDYFAFARAKKNKEELEKTNPQNPVLKKEDEDFLDKVASHDAPPAPFPPTLIKDDGTTEEAKSQALEANEVASSIALPADSTPEATNPTSPKRTWGSYVPSLPSAPSMPALPAMPSLPAWRSKSKPRNLAAASSSDDASKDEKDATVEPEEPNKSGESVKSEDSQESGDAVKSEDAAKSGDAEDSSADKVDGKLEDKTNDKTNAQQQESAYPPGVRVTENVKLDQAKQDEDEKEVSLLLDRLNLSSINNRVFSFSKESQKIYEDFTIVLKDMINGAPTAYEDMEKLLKDNDTHLRDMFNNMPPFVQTLVKSLPAKLGGTLGPEMLAAASNKPGADLKSRMATASQPPPSPPTKSNKQKSQIPSVKGLANEKGAIATMLRSIVAFLKTRFPAFVTGTNVIMSIAVFVLLFVFWYCHKRGKETRIQREADAASINDVSDVDSEELDEAQDLTPDESEAVDEKDEGEEGEEDAADVEAPDAKTPQIVLNQTTPAAVAVPTMDEGKVADEAANQQ